MESCLVSNKGNSDYFLIVDDEKDISQLMSLHLTRFIDSDQVLTSINGKQAYDVCLEKDISVLFLDLRMPVYNGEWFLEQVINKRESEEQLLGKYEFLKNTKIILFSSDDSKMKELSNSEKYKDLITDCLSKPFSSNDLKEKLDEHKVISSK